MARSKKSESLTAALSSELKSKFDLTKFKEKKMLNSNVKFKEQRWIPLSTAFQDVTSVPGIPMGQPKLMNKGGFAMWFDATFVVTFGNISNAGTSKIKAIKDGKQVEFAKRTNIQIDKNHINGVQSRGKIIMTPHGFINDTDKELKAYKDAHASEWMKVLGGMDFDIFEEQDSFEPENIFTQEPD